MKRNPVVAGTFFSGDSVILRREIEHFLEKAAEFKQKEIFGIISPHAGYMYSGQCAGFAYKALKERDFDVAVILSPSHRYGHFKFSAGNYESYLTPLGEVKVDSEKVEQLLFHTDFSFHPTAHNSEHSLEVQLPFLQVINPSAKIVPILLGQQTAENSRLLADILSAEFKDKLEKTIFIVSTDLSHYYEGEVAKTMDMNLINMIRSLDIAAIENGIFSRQVEACGFGGIIALLYLAEKFGYKNLKVLNYTHSGMISGDDSKVVGYLAGAIYR